MKYLNFLRQKIYLGILIILGCAMLGSVLGARKESKEPLNGITEGDIILMEQESPDAPRLIGILPLASNQNKWYNFKYAFIFAGFGAIIFCVFAAIYLHLYYLRLFVQIRKFMGIKDEKENPLFIKLS